MNTLFRTAVVAVSLGLSATAFAQSKAPASSNPVGRGDNVLFFSPLQGSAQTFSNPLARAPGGAVPRSQSQVTPVPEPGEWAMLLAGLALIGFIVRRNSKR